MRHDNPGSILKATELAPESNQGPGEGDFLQRVNATITNFKELGKIFIQLKGEREEEEPGVETNPKTPANPQPRTPGLLDYVQLAIKAGYGDTPIGELIEQVSPHTLKKVLEIFQSAGLKK